MIEQALLAHLNLSTSVTEIVGDRIYGPSSPQHKALPRINLQRIDTPRLHHLRGPDGLAHPRIQIDCFAATYAEALTLADAVRLSDGGQAGKTLQKFRGTMGGHSVQSCRIEDERDIPDEPQDGGERPVYGRSLDVVIWFDEET